MIGKEEKVYFVDIVQRCPLAHHTFLKVRQFFILNNYTITNDMFEADVLVVNTCGAVDPIVEKGEAYLANLLHKKAAKYIVILGCLAKLTNKFSQTPSVMLIPHDDIDRFSKYFECQISIRDIGAIFHLVSKLASDHFIIISHGCENDCSYCNIKLAKGYVHSRSIAEIKNEFSSLVEGGHYKITLLADDSGSYGHDINTNITELISELLEIDKKVKIGIYNFFPGTFLKYYADLKQFLLGGRIINICIPLQSGSPKILKLMNRNYDLERLRAVIEEVREHNPDIYLYTHFIFGFPTETRQDFENSIAWAKYFDHSLFLPYVDNKKSAAHTIIPKCSKEEMKNKIQLIKSKDIRIDLGEILPEALR